MMKLRMWVALVVVACGGKAAAPSAPSNTADTTAPAPPNPLRKWGFPTDAECHAAVDAVMAIVKTNPEKTKQMTGDDSEAEVHDEGFQECRREWVIAQLDCIHASKTFDALDTCMRADYTPPENTDLTTAPGHATAGECEELANHVIGMSKTGDEGVRAEFREKCLRKWHPQTRDCIRKAQSLSAVEQCGQSQSGE